MPDDIHFSDSSAGLGEPAYDAAAFAVTPSDAPAEAALVESRGYPYRTVVYITYSKGGSHFQASGVMLSPDEVLTATHVVYSSDVGTSYDIRVAPGFNAGSAPFGSSAVEYAHYNPINNPGGRISSFDSQSDFAVLHLSTPLDVGTMSYEANFGGGAVHISGYPGASRGVLNDIATIVTRDPTYTLLDGTSLGPGSSGGPVWIDRNGAPTVVGIVSSQSSTTGYNVQITDRVYSQVQQWIAQDDYTNALVDKAFYRARNPDVAAAPVNPAYHYVTSGWKEGRDPNPYFSDSGYLAFNRDVTNAGLNPLDHYAASGWKEGRNPGANFDTALYLLHNPDVARAGINPLLHYMQSGRAEGRAAYASIGPAAKFAGDFDPEFYLLSNPDVARAGVDPTAHFMATGWREGRNPDAFFDTRAYLNANPDVVRAGVNPLLHFERDGWKEGRNPSGSFNTASYKAANPDVAAAGIDPLQHYLQHGAFESRLPQGTGVL